MNLFFVTARAGCERAGCEGAGCEGAGCHRNAGLARLRPVAMIVLILVACVIWRSHGTSAYADQVPTRPNIIFILADDLGYGDLGCYGHPVAKTPNIDALAKDGVRFTQHYSNGPECSPTRTAFLTGRYQQRVGGLECAIGTGNVGRYDDAIRLASTGDLGLPVDKAVMPRMMIEQGYRCGLFGKWHLGYDEQFNPMHYGWQEFFGYLGGNVHYFNHRELSDLHVLFEGDKPVTRDGYMSHLITQNAIDFIKDGSDQPFFLFVSHECPHFPYQGPGDRQKSVTEENWMDLDPSAYVAMLEDLDHEVGRLMTTLAEESIDKNTLVVFASDNGGFAGAANMGPLQGSKGTTMEGGIRVPLIMRWPDKILAGQVSDQVCLTFDLTRSFVNLAGSGSGAGREGLEGYDIVSHVVDQKESVKRTVYWRGRRADKTWAAVRDGDLKYVRKQIGDATQQLLFDLDADQGETSDLSATRSIELVRLRSLLDGWETEVRADR